MKPLHRIIAAVIFILPLFTISATSAETKSLYERLGGEKAIAAVTDDFLADLIADKKLGRYFVGFSTDSKKRIRQDVIDFLCKAAGGPCDYKGRDMKTAHAGIGITKAEWNRSGRILGKVLAKYKVFAAEQKELNALIGPLEKDIVDHP